ncbi:MAG: aminoglycoside phosphotransferase [Naasia sp.]
MTSLVPAALLEQIVSRSGFREWVAAQRWYPGGGGTPALSLIASYPLGERGVVALVRDAVDGAVYQVPLAIVEEGAATDATTILRVDGADVIDGTRDGATCLALYALATSGGAIAGRGVDVAGAPSAPSPGVAASARVLSGEQSNTSIIFDVPDSAPVIIKLFRLLHAGENPDVVLQTAIAAAGSDAVPRSLGAVEGVWDGARGHLAFAQEFLPGTRDAWRVALDAAVADEDFTARSRALGAATAEVHRILSAALPTEPASGERVAALVAGFRVRAEAAFVAVPALRELAPAIEAAYGAAAAEEWPELQRIHGDYHLGQVLDAPDRGWVLLDFEGEPLRPMSERNEPDLALRDVAGMLRSFDSAAGSVSLADPAAGDRAGRWALAAREAFLDGYGRDALAAHPRLLAALEIDKALYEAVYEFRNRPTWLPIPVTAIRRLLTPTS